MLLYFDAGVSLALGMGIWAVVLDDDGELILLDREVRGKTKVHELEKLASEKAAEYAGALGVETIRGDCLTSIMRAKKTRPRYDWEWVPSKENLADGFTKDYHAAS